MGVIRSIILTLLVGLSVSVFAQEVPQVHKINGSKYYLHVVEKGNTLYGISKLYNVGIDQIHAENPLLATEGLKINQTLLIPVTSDNKKELGAVVEQNEEFLLHEVQAKETLYAISKRYDITLDALLNANPEIRENGLKAGSTVKIPVAKVKDKEESAIQSAAPNDLETHTALKGETIYSISKSFNVQMDELLKENPMLAEGLKEGMVVRIPGRKLEETRPTADITPVIEELETLIPVKSLPSGSAVRICLLLPVVPVFPDSTIAIEDFKITEAQRVALHFFRGFMYAMDSLNLHCKVTLLASGQDTQSVGYMIRHGELDPFDIVVGPFYTNQFEVVADHLKQKGIPVICPIPKPSKILFNRPNAMKITPSESMQLDALAELLAAEYRDSNVVVVNTNKFPDQELIEFFKDRYGKALHVPDTFIADAIREVKFWDITREALTMRFPDSGSYVLVVPTKNKVFVTKFLSELYNLVYETKDKYKFRIIGLEDWEKYDSDLDIQQLHTLRVTLPIAGYVDFSDYRVNAFYRHYKMRYGFEPDRFTLIGFDLGAYLAAQTGSNHRAEWFRVPEQFQYEGVLGNYHFHRVMSTSGVENQSVDFYQYKDFRLKSFATWPHPEKK
jgi:LysM repeat protein